MYQFIHQCTKYFIYNFVTTIFSKLTPCFTCDIFDLINLCCLIKNKRKVYNDSSNYRAIAINSSFCKVLYYIIINHFENLLISKTNGRQ